MSAGSEGVGVRFLVVRRLPMMVAALGEDEAERRLATALAERGLVELPRFLGVELPRGMPLGVTLTPQRLELVDEREQQLLRAPREAVDPDWVDEALRLRGTMLLVARELELDPDEAPRELADRLEAAAGEGRLLGGIVGVAEERPTLPLMLQ